MDKADIKQKEIEKMTDIIHENMCYSSKEIANELYNAGCRVPIYEGTKSNLVEETIYDLIKKVRDNTAKEIFNALYHQEEIGFDKIKWFAKYYYDIEVDE